MEESDSKRGLATQILMVRPHNFRSNEMTSVNNHYQQKSSDANVNDKALEQFDCLVGKLRSEGIQVIVVQDDGKNDTPDSVFPNNWISFHPKHRYNLYPLFAPNRRTERLINIFSPLKEHGITPQLFKDYSKGEDQGLFLEGTGSLVLDSVNKVAYAAIAARTNEKLALQFCQQNGYKPCFFKAYQTVNGKRELIYHTNVVMWVGDRVCGVCLKCIDDEKERKQVEESLRQSQMTVIELSEEQIGNFAGNSIMLKGKNQPILVMSTRVFERMTESQIKQLPQDVKIVHSDLRTIEDYGGGSARCTIAEIF